MRVYVDASVMVSFMVSDEFTERAEIALKRLASEIVLSDFGGAEFASAIARKVRERELNLREARKTIAAYDELVATRAELVSMISDDIAACNAYLRRLDLPLRAPDGMHIAMASRLGAAILSFDTKLVESARELGVRVERA